MRTRRNQGPYKGAIPRRKTLHLAPARDRKACEGVPRRRGSYSLSSRFAVSANLLRRHLDESQRGIVAAAFAQIPHGVHAADDRGAKLPISEAAELFNI